MNEQDNITSPETKQRNTMCIEWPRISKFNQINFTVNIVFLKITKGTKEQSGISCLKTVMLTPMQFHKQTLF